MSAPQIQYPPTSGGGTPTGGSGTANTIPLWTGSTPSTTLTDSLLSQASTIITNSGTFRAANGAPAEPAYTFSGSSGTGMYRATSGALLRFAVSSAYAFGVDTNGNLGIGTPSPTATSTIYKANNSLGAWNAQDLSVDGLSNGDAVYQRWYATGIAGAVGRFGVTFQSSVASFVWNSLFNSGVQTAELMRLTGGGNLGIGTASPLGKLQVGSAATLSNYQASMVGIMLPTGSGNWLELCENSVNGTTFKIGKDASTGVTICGNSKDLGFSAGGYQSFVNSCQMVLKTSGNLGIGTASPGSIVDVLRTANSTTNLQVRNLSATAAAQARLDIVSDAGTLVAGMVSSTWTSAGLANGDGYIWNLANRSLSFGTNSTERARIDSSGNVGIGTASPNKKFQVLDGATGEVRFTTTANVVGNTITQRFSSNAGAGAYEGGGAYIQAIQGSGIDVWSLAFGTANLSATAQERVRIDSTGRLGVGLSPSTYILETATDASVYGVRVGRGAGAVSSNTAVGASALNANTTGSQNTAVGNFAANAATTGASNTSIGFQANALLQGGSRNTAVGESAGYAALSSTDNTAIGRYAAVYNTGNNNVAVGSAALNGTLGSSTGGNNVAVGMQSGQSITTGTNNVFVGYVAGSGVTTGQSNTMIGYATASGGTTTGGDNTLVGAVAGNQITSGANNVCVGSNAGQTQTSANDNTYIGKNAGYFQTASSNTAVGRSALLGTTGSNGVGNSALGHSALQAVTSGQYNTSIGFNAGGSITSGSSNISIGTDAGPAAGTDSNVLAIGSTLRWAATNGGATTYYATAGASLGYIQVRLNGANVKIQVFAP